MKKTVISVMGKDTVGIISKVSSVCAQNNVNIIDITQSVLQGLFVMVMLTDTENLKCEFSEFSESMKKLGENAGVEIRVMHEDIFNSMHRI
ncbi:MAG: ACT domain-containing protein [Clostridia bacterium]|nr:ACT domain-containing protein [Clostridia bacterium]